MPPLEAPFDPENNSRYGLLRRILLIPLRFPNLIAWITSTIIPLLVISIAASSYYLDHIRSQLSNEMENDETFDFIIVGGGSAGSVLANRLSTKYTVLLLEAGGDPHPFSYFPTTSLVTLNLPMIDWGYETVPQRNACLAFQNQVMRWPRGKGLGGSSVNNQMMYMRGNPLDFDEWAVMSQDKGWSYESLLKYFRKLEDYNGYETSESAQYHGKGGPMHIEKLRFSPGLNRWLEAGKELGNNIVDPNGYQSIGFGGMDVTMKNGRRFSTCSAYLHPIIGRSTLTILRYAEVTKIHLDHERKATGVTYKHHNQFKFIKASKEVIVSGGSINSPKLLMLSGIGPKEHLSSVGIETVLNLPAVGQHLEDHVFTVLGPFLLNTTESFVLDRDLNLKAFTDFIFNGSGPIVSVAGISGFALLSSSISQGKYPDIYINHIGIGVHASFGRELDQTFGFRPGLMEKFLSPYAGRDAVFAAVNLARTKSVGEIKLKSSNPFEYPYIDPKYLSHPDDVKVMVEGIKAAINIYEKTRAFQKVGAKLAPSPYPTCQDVPFRSDEYWECYVKYYTLTVYHPCGTCRMGYNSQTAVVDSRLRVFNTTGLRVVDASVIPAITNTNLHAPTLALAEKAADMILQDWEQRETTHETKDVTNNPSRESETMVESDTRENPVYILDPRK